MFSGLENVKIDYCPLVFLCFVVSFLVEAHSYSRLVAWCSYGSSLGGFGGFARGLPLASLEAFYLRYGRILNLSLIWNLFMYIYMYSHVMDRACSIVWD